MNEVQGYASREAVLHILQEQEATGAFLKDLFPRHADHLPPQDRALARELAHLVLRNRSLLDWNVDLHATRKPGPGILRTLLRLGAAQLLLMDVPAFAAVNVTVELAKRKGGKEKAGFVNAVLKRLAAEGLKRPPGNTLKALAVSYSHPLWLVERWHRRLGPKGLLAAMERNNQEAPLWIRINPCRATMAEARARLLELGALPMEEPSGGPPPEAPLYLRLGPGGGEKVLRSDLFARGAVAFQDPAAWLVAELAAWRPGESLLDLCSAPGGKAACLVERACYRGEVAEEPAAYCNDLSWRRLRRIHDARERLGHRALRPLVMDPARAALKASARFDLIVVDAPCSNLGVLRRRPEARWNHGLGDIARLADLQKSLLRSAATLASARGRIVYATCSPEPEETAEVVAAFLAEHPGWVREDASARLPAWAVKEGCLWIHPGESEYDGFFAAGLVRREAA